MIQRPMLTHEPWAILESELDLETLAETESIFALSNGHIGLRGNLDEGEPHGVPGSYLNGVFESVPLPYAEAGYGYPEVGQSLIDVTNGKHIRLLVDDEPLDVRHGTLDRHVRLLDLRDGVLRREVEWTSPAMQKVRVRSTRLVSFVQRAIAAVSYEVEAIDEAARITVQSSLVANEPIPVKTDDPRAAAALRAPLVSEFHNHNGTQVTLGHRTRVSGLGIVASLDHIIDGPDRTVTSVESEPDLARLTVSTELQPGQRLHLLKFIAYGWSSTRSMPALRDQVDAALAAATRTGWDGLLAGQREYLDEVWSNADIEIEGDPELQQALRFALFQVIQAGARAERRAIGAKGLTGRGYDGHTFWDMEMYTLPVLTYTAPAATADALRWRHSTLPLARNRARELGLRGASFPWRTIRGEECSGYWPAGTASFHVNAAVAEGVRRYVWATGDEEFERTIGLEILVETARLWRSLGHFDAEGCFRIDGVTGPDEYSALADNNTYTNLMAARNLYSAASAARRHPAEAAALEVDEEETSSWMRAADQIVIPYDSELHVTSQAEGFTRYRRWNFRSTPAENYPLLMHYPYYLLYSSQVVKQADLVLALYLFGDRFDFEQKQRDFGYYEAITVRDSSLSAPIQAIVAAEVGHLDLAFDYLREAAMIDLHNRAGNTGDGLHLASLAGAWLAIVAGFGGMRDNGDTLSFAPTLPIELTGIRFRLRFRGRKIEVAIREGEARYTLFEGEPIDIVHHGKTIRLTTDEPQTVARPDPPTPLPAQPPPGREPLGYGIGMNDHEPHLMSDTRYRDTGR